MPDMLQSQLYHAVRQLENGQWTFVNEYNHPMSGRFVEDEPDAEPELDLYGNAAYLYATEEAAMEAAVRYEASLQEPRIITLPDNRPCGCHGLESDSYMTMSGTCKKCGSDMT